MKQSAHTLTYGGLVGAVALAGASQAYGTIINVAPPTSITGSAGNAGTRVYWDIDTGTTTAAKTAASDFQFLYVNNSAGVFETGISGYNGSEAAAYLITSANVAYAYNLPAGQQIGTGSGVAFGQSTKYFTVLNITYNGQTYNSQMQAGSPYFVGFEFKATDGLLHDGWIELESDYYTSPASPGGLKFIAAAYNSVADSAGGTIAAGQMGTNAIPEPGTLAALAVGAAALSGVGLKRRRKAASTNAQD